MAPRDAALRLCAAFTLLSGTACDASPQDIGALDDGRDYFPTEQWRIARARALGFDEARFERMLRDAHEGRYGSLHGLIVIRNGYVAAERYYDWSAATPHTVQSVTKSVTSLLFGIVRARHPDSAALQRPLLEVLPQYAATIANDDTRKRSITLQHMLSMRTGIDFFEQPYPGSPLDELNRSRDDWVRLVLDRPMIAQPGSQWAYNSGAPIVMCGVMRELMNEPVDVFAQRELFEPIGVRGASWVRSAHDQLPHCGGGLNLRALDLARIGYLVLRRGQWQGRQLVDAGWIEESTAAISTGPTLFFHTFNSSYGYYWWGFPVRRGGSDHGVIAASGSGGQWLFVVPSRDLVIVVVAQNGAGLDLLYDGILSALDT
jgi:CubicO group peptidase (beta-lactamase class C family)